MTMTQTAIEVSESRPPLSRGTLATWVLGGALLLAVGAWIVFSAVTNPTQFASAVVTGINNGALYALIALGYTLVYGIIELINFSHGDLFMLSTILAGFVIVTVFGATSPSVYAIFVAIVALFVCMGGGAGLNVAAE